MDAIRYGSANSLSRSERGFASGQTYLLSVLNEEYAVQIARDWNAKDSGAGYVTRFRVRKEFIAKYPVQTVGDSRHKELWIPAEELPAFNENIVGEIELVAEFHPGS